MIDHSKLFKQNEIPSNEIIINKGELCKKFYIIQEGEILISGINKSDETKLYSGECFGETALTSTINSPEC